MLYVLAMPIKAEVSYVRGKILHFIDNPAITAELSQSYQYLEDGVIKISDGKIIALSSWEDIENNIDSKHAITHYQDGLIMPGFIDTHIHFPQLDMIAADSSGDLLQWLENYTFPFERRMQDASYAKNVAEFFLDELIRNGTTTAMIFGSSYPEAVEALFQAAQYRSMRIITGQIIADINLPEYLLQNIEQSISDTRQLINKWHNKPGTRLAYAITPRFAPTTSAELMAKIQELKQEYPDIYLHTHLSENKNEVVWANEVHNSDSYLAIYDRYDWLGKQSLMAHSIHLTDTEWKRMQQTQTPIAFCPTSNLFLGSGLFDLAKANEHKLMVGLGTDVGAGTSFSLLNTLNNAYKVLQLNEQTLNAFEGFYLATLGGAKALNLSNKLGNFLPGKEADFIVLDIKGRTLLLERRLQYANSLSEKLFVMMMLADDRSVVATYIGGKKLITYVS